MIRTTFDTGSACPGWHVHIRQPNDPRQQHQPGTLEPIGRRRLGQATYDYSRCLDCGTEYPHLKGGLPSCNGRPIGRCPWCESGPKEDPLTSWRPACESCASRVRRLELDAELSAMESRGEARVIRVESLEAALEAFWNGQCQRDRWRWQFDGTMTSVWRAGSAQTDAALARQALGLAEGRP